MLSEHINLIFYRLSEQQFLGFTFSIVKNTLAPQKNSSRSSALRLLIHVYGYMYKLKILKYMYMYFFINVKWIMV